MRLEDLGEVIDKPYSCSINPPTTKETLDSLKNYRGVLEDDEFKRLREENRNKPLP